MKKQKTKVPWSDPLYGNTARGFYLYNIAQILENIAERDNQSVEEVIEEFISEKREAMTFEAGGYDKLPAVNFEIGKKFLTTKSIIRDLKLVLRDMHGDFGFVH